MATSRSSRENVFEGLPPSSEEVGWTEEEEEALVGPVYLRLDDLAFRSYGQYAPDDNALTYELEEEIADEDIGLDLNAPPPES